MSRWAYRPLAAAPYAESFGIHVALMGVALLAAVYLLRRLVPVIDRHYWAAAALALAFYPMLRAVMGGQNTALTLVLIVGVWRAIRSDHPVIAGVLLGLLAYKPQFAIPLIGLHLLAGHRRTVVAAGATGAALFGVGWALLGVGWVADWWQQAADFARLDIRTSGHTSVSLLGFLQSVLGVDDGVALALGWIGVAAVATALAWMWWQRRADYDTRIGVTAAGLLLLPPHALYYDVGLLIVTFAALSSSPLSRLDRGLLAVAVVAAVLQPLSSVVGFSLTIFAVIAAGAVAARRVLVAPPTPIRTAAG